MTEALPEILLVGKHQERVSHLDKYLASTGWKYHLARDSSAVREAMQTKDFDLVIADLEFSGNEGTELFHLVQKTKPGQAVIVISHDGSVKEAITVLRLGARDFLQYPLDFDTLERRVSDVLTGAQQRTFVDQPVDNEGPFSLTYQLTSAEFAANPFELCFLDDLESAGKLQGDEKLQIVLAFQEAVTNSLEHGNLELKSEWKDEIDEEGIDKYSLRKKARLADPQYGQRMLELRIEYRPDQLSFVIRDEGPGFKTNLQHKKKNDSGILCYGRGMAIISSAMDFVEYRDDGRLIEMRRTLHSV